MKMKLNFILKYLLSLYLSVFYFFPSFGSPGRNCTTNLSRSSPQLNQAPQTGRNSSGNQGNNHWLYDHENRGGHLISRHISKSDDELRNRANIERKVSVSSFHNFESADKFVSTIISQNQSDINLWKANVSDQQSFVIQLKRGITESGNTLVSSGKIYNDRHGRIENAYNAKVVLLKDNRMREGYKILTGYPVN